jgi:hypothetical protein
VDPILNVVKLTTKLCAVVCPIILDPLLDVDPNALSVQNVQMIRLARIRNALILAPELADKMPNAESIIIVLSAIALSNTLAIRLLDVTLNHVRNLLLNPFDPSS